MENNCEKFYIALYDYEQGQAIFESPYFDTEEEALDFAKNSNFVYASCLTVELIRIDENKCADFIRQLDLNEYGNLGKYNVYCYY